jgi:hypothetical protein
LSTSSAMRSSSSSDNRALPSKHGCDDLFRNPSKNVDEMAQRGLRASAAGHRGHVDVPTPASSWVTCPFSSRTRSCVRTVE